LLEEASAEDAIRPTRLNGLDVLPADGRLADCTMLLAAELGKERRLRLALGSLEDSYAICIVDASPALTLLSVNVLQAVNEVIVPLDPGVFSISGLGRLQETVDRVRHYLEHPELAIVGLLLTRFVNTKASRDLQAQLREVHGSLVFSAVIPATVRVEEAHSRNLTIMEWAPESPVAKAYGALTLEVLKHGQFKNRHARKRRSRHDAA
jgi:chromosome partitioning protein